MRRKENILNKVRQMILSACWIVCVSSVGSLAWASPLINAVSEAQTLYGEDSTATLWASVTPESDGLGISGVWAEIIPFASPDERVTVELWDSDNDGVYEGSYDGFTTEGGYVIAIRAEDSGENASFAQTSVTVRKDTAEPDSYEDDDSSVLANVIVIGDERPQHHNFHEGEDEDWIKFFGIRGQTYDIKVSNLDERYNILIELYYGSEMTVLMDESEGHLSCKPLSADGIYYVRLYEDDSDAGVNTGYDLEIAFKDAPVASPFRFGGTVRDAFSAAPLGDVMIKTASVSETGDLTGSGFSALSEQDGGSYVLYHSTTEDSETLSMKKDSVTLNARFSGYKIFEMLIFMTTEGFRMLPESEDAGDGTLGRRLSESQSDVSVNVADLIEWDGLIEMFPLGAGDINGDDEISLTDALMALQIVAGAHAEEALRSDYAESGADANGDKKVGMEEVIRILQAIIASGL